MRSRGHTLTDRQGFSESSFQNMTHDLLAKMERNRTASHPGVISTQSYDSERIEDTGNKLRVEIDYSLTASGARTWVRIARAGGLVRLGRHCDCMLYPQ